MKNSYSPHSIQRIRKDTPDKSRMQLYQRAILIAIIGNGTLAIAKGGAAWFSGSTAVLATAVDAMTDVVYTIFMAWGLRLSQQPPDENHPQGHARIEPVISAIIGLMMGTAGLEVIKRAVGQLFGQPSQFEWGLPALVLVGSGIAKVVMYFLVLKLGKNANSPAIKASARDNLTDVYSSGAALVGVIGAKWLHPMADPIAGIIVSIWIFSNVINILAENVGYLTGRAAEHELVEKIFNAASKVTGVANVHQIIADYVGPQLRVDMHIDVDGNTPLCAAHDINEAVVKAVESLDEVDQAFVHVEPL